MTLLKLRLNPKLKLKPWTGRRPPSDRLAARLPALKRIAVCLLFGLFFSFRASGFLFAETFTFKADRMSGNKATGKEVTVLIGNAEVRSDNLLLKADRIELLGEDNNVIDCSGSVWGHQEEKQIFFRSDKMTYNRDKKIAVMEGNSTLEDKKNQIVARGRFIEYDEGSEITVFQISVRLFKDNMVCRSEYAVYRREEQLLDLSGFPIVYKKNDEFKADRIRVDLETDDVIMEGSVSGSIKE
jgi:lipopolysaccharide export system protein LptA